MLLSITQIAEKIPLKVSFFKKQIARNDSVVLLVCVRKTFEDFENERKQR